MPLTWDSKDPDEVRDYEVDWSYRLIRGDEISSASFTLATAAGMTIDSSEHDYRHKSRVRLSGGTAGQRGKVLCQIVTEDGQTLQDTATLVIRAR